MRFKIVADSSADVLNFPHIPYASVPLKINTTASEYVDDASLNVALMVEEIKNTKGKSSTSCPNIHEWLRAFGNAENVFAITITSNLSTAATCSARFLRHWRCSHRSPFAIPSRYDESAFQWRTKPSVSLFLGGTFFTSWLSSGGRKCIPHKH
jgi:hypothetical protein